VQTEIAALYKSYSGKKQPEEISAIEAQGNPGEIDIDSLPVNYGTKKLIKDGEAKGSRSEAMMSVVDSLVNLH
jgi:hypothetical protein